MIKLMSIEFPNNGIRKLKNLKIDFADRITLIAGFNGIGKSTILGLVASASGLTVKGTNSYLNKSFSVDINEIIHLDPEELESEQLKAPWPKLVYSVKTPQGKIEHWKNISITKRPERLRSVARTDKNSPDTELTGPDAKIPLPTIYLGMLRMLPIGECLEKDIISKDESIAPEDANFLNDFINKVINGTKLQSENKLTTQSINNTKKSSKHPDYGHTSKSVSLGQDSLSSIATAITSFNKLKREQGDNYRGGILVIDEIDAGFHPHAQQNLIDALGSAARNLSLQIIATTHSSKLIEYMHPESKIRQNTQRIIDKVIYLSDTTSPKLTDNWTLERIIADMSLSTLPKETKEITPIIKAYLEDDEAAIFMKKILRMNNNYKTYNGPNYKKKLHIIPIGVGCSSIAQLPTHDDYFKTVLLVLDGDNVSNSRTITNILNLPATINPSTGTGFNPERTLYSYIEELLKGSDSCFKETCDKLFEKGYTTDRLRNYFLSNNQINMTKRESSKKWFKAVYGKIDECDLITLWANDHKTEVDEFTEKLKIKLDELVETNKKLNSKLNIIK